MTFVAIIKDKIPKREIWILCYNQWIKFLKKEAVAWGTICKATISTEHDAHLEVDQILWVSITSTLRVDGQANTDKELKLT